MGGADHGIAQDRVYPDLVALALALKPCHDIRINDYERMGFDGFVKRAGYDVFPELFCQRPQTGCRAFESSASLFDHPIRKNVLFVRLCHDTVCSASAAALNPRKF